MRRSLLVAGLSFFLACGGGDDPGSAPSEPGTPAGQGGGGSGGASGGQGGVTTGLTGGAGTGGGAGTSVTAGAAGTSDAGGSAGSVDAGGSAGSPDAGGSAGTSVTAGAAGTSDTAGAAGAPGGGGGAAGGGPKPPEVVKVGDDAKSPAPGPVKVHLDQQGKKFTDWGFDIKQTCGKRAEDGSCVPPVAAKMAASQAFADEIFKSGDMAVIRIPIRADELGVDANGDVRPGFYKEVIQAVKNARTANPAVRVLASRSTITDCELESAQCKDYAPSLKEGGKVVIAKYAKLLSRYLTFMAGAGVKIDVLGVENEPHNNFGEGDLATCFKQATDGCADRFYQLITSLKNQHDKPLPQIVGDDAGTPDVEFANALTKDSKWGLFDMITTHYQSGDRAARHELLDTLAAKARNHDRPIWDTEYHYDDLDKQGEYADGVHGVFGVLDHFDARFSGIVWWAFKPRSTGTSKSQIQSAMVESTANTVPLGTDDGDGPKLERTLLGSRAFRRGNNKVFVWLVNDTDKPSTGKPIRLLDGATLVPATGPAPYEQWVLKPNGENGAMSHDAGRAFPVSGGVITASLPARSITVVEITK